MIRSSRTGVGGRSGVSLSASGVGTGGLSTKITAASPVLVCCVCQGRFIVRVPLADEGYSWLSSGGPFKDHVFLCSRLFGVMLFLLRHVLRTSLFRPVVKT